MSGNQHAKRFVIAAIAMLASSVVWAADGDPWSVSKASGEVWLTTQGAQQVALGSDNMLKPGDTIRTGRNGRVLLTRGAETMLIAPNSVIGLPTEAQDGMGTTILQRAGSILLDVEHRNVKHFEVETPYLAAVVKGTQFRVTIDSGSTKVDVSRGQVEVSDFKSGQIAQVTPGQTATSFAHGDSGLHLSGSGTFAPIEQGRPRVPTIQRVPVPNDGLHAPREAKGDAKGSSVHVVGPVNTVPANPTAKSTAQRQGAVMMPKPHGVHISSTLGEVKLNVGSATHGLAHGAAAPGVRNGSHQNTIWNNNSNTVAGTSSANSNSSAGTDSTSAAAVSASVAAAIGSANASANIANTSASGSADLGTNASGNSSNSGSQGKSTSNGNGNGNDNDNDNGNGANNADQWATYWAQKANGNGNGNSSNSSNGKGNGSSNGNGSGNGNGNGNGNGHH